MSGRARLPGAPEGGRGTWRRRAPVARFRPIWDEKAPVARCCPPCPSAESASCRLPYLQNPTAFDPFWRPSPVKLKILLPSLAAAALLAAGCGGASDDSGATAASSSSGGGKNTSTLSLVAYSTPEVVYDELIPGFKATAPGKGVGFKTSFGASGDQSRAVEAGLKADVVAFSLAPDVDRLVKAGLVDGTWADTPTKGLVSTSVVALVVRKGNPKHIKGWDDLLKPGVEVVTPNPFSSGGAKWNIMAAYGGQLAEGKSEAQAQDYVKKLLTKVPVLDKSAREALQTFSAGKGDVLIAYENEAITARQKGEKLDY